MISHEGFSSDQIKKFILIRKYYLFIKIIIILDGSFPQDNPNSKLSGKTKKIDGLLIKIFDRYDTKNGYNYDMRK